ncbi:MAG: GrpB family protein, partial [bacterium]
MIGLQRGIVDVLPHQGDWQGAFEAERASILAHAAELVVDIQHVGSTSVAGLDAKPIVDIAAAVESPEV